MSDLIYLASPYTHPDEQVKKARFELVAFEAGKLLRQGRIVFSPILHFVPIAEAHGLPTDWEFWKYVDKGILEKCEAMWVLGLPGHENSEGILAEKKIAKDLNIPVSLICPAMKAVEFTFCMYEYQTVGNGEHPQRVFRKDVPQAHIFSEECFSIPNLWMFQALVPVEFDLNSLPEYIKAKEIL